MIPEVTHARSKLLIPLKDSFFMCSTLHMQDEVLLRLMKRNTILDGPKVLRQTLTKIKFASEVEILYISKKYIFSWANAETKEYEELVWNVLVTLLGIVSDQRFDQLQACNQSLHGSSLLLNNRLKPPSTIFPKLIE
ncbi:hypothetical protein MJO28_017181 [Puccinia striiformis f. sp. tritici]|nr:hypothetical protein MJO28_017181 [Puccinia striiformis f. sp. tritici]